MRHASRRVAEDRDAAEPERPTHDHVFNSDILMNDDDVSYVREHFPHIWHVLDNEELRAVFAKYEMEADAARDRVRLLGFSAVIFGILALLTFPTRPLWEDIPHARWVALALEAAGILAAAVSSGGFWLGPWKRRWLESRLMTERLRQWHFQLLLRRGREIEASMGGPAAVEVFRRKRSQWLDEFLKAYEGHLDSKLEALIGELAHSETWLHWPRTEYSRDSRALDQIFDAYRQLRLDHQYGFAVYQLRRTDGQSVWNFLTWPPIRQASFLSGVAFLGFSVALCCSALLIYGYAFGMPDTIERAIRAIAISFALLGLGLRTLKEGLAPEQEMERYNDYRGRTSQLRERFAETDDDKERLYVMEELERAAVDEMRGFLRTHQRAAFLLT